jgi:hypothetical protein
MKKIFLLFVLSIFYQYNILCQNDTQLSDTTLYKVKVTTGNWDIVKANKLDYHYLPRNIVLYDKYNKESSYNLSNIYSIEQQKGNRAWLYGAVGAVGAFFISYAIAYSGDDPNDYNDGLESSTIGAIIIGGTSVGFSLGFIIGSSSKKYKKIYYNGQFVF